MQIRNKIKRGDTLIEVLFAITVFSVISVISLQIMNKDLAAIQGTLESEMARNEIDSQAEAIRFIHNAFLSERELASNKRTYQNLWYKLSRSTDDTSQVNSIAAGYGLANNPRDISKYFAQDTCDAYYNTYNDDEEIHNLFKDNAFVINTRNVDPDNVNETIIQSGRDEDKSKFIEAPLYPRIIFTKDDNENDNSQTAVLSELFEGGKENLTNIGQNSAEYKHVSYAEGIWVISAKDITKEKQATADKTPEFYDFHIRTCWFAPGHERPSTIATTIRLYNPEFIEGAKK